jgi:hypothetical protein
VLTSEETVTVEAPDRRVVQQVTQGRFAGIYRIIGRVCDLVEGTEMSPETRTPLPSYVDLAQLIDHVGPMALVKLTPRYVLYRESIPPPTGVLNETFHPQQR